MVITLILAVIAGLGARHVRPQITEFCFRFFDEDHMPKDADQQILAFAVSLAMAAVILWLLGAGGHSVVLLVGGTAAYFQKELREAVMSRR